MPDERNAHPPVPSNRPRPMDKSLSGPRQQLALLLGRLLARRWLRSQQYPPTRQENQEKPPSP